MFARSLYYIKRLPALLQVINLKFTQLQHKTLLIIFASQVYGSDPNRTAESQQHRNN